MNLHGSVFWQGKNFTCIPVKWGTVVVRFCVILCSESLQFSEPFCGDRQQKIRTSLHFFSNPLFCCLFDSLLLYQEGLDQKSILVLNGRAECNPLAPGMWYTWNGFKKAQPLLLLLRARWGKRIYNNKIIMKIFFCEKARAATWILPLFLIIIILVISSFDTLKQSTRAVYQKKENPFLIPP